MKSQVTTRVIVLALSILILLVVGAFFINNFGNASGDIQSTGITVDETKCQRDCQALLSIGFNYNSCEELISSPKAQEYLTSDCQSIYGPCTVTITKSINCVLE